MVTPLSKSLGMIIRHPICMSTANAMQRLINVAQKLAYTAPVLDYFSLCIRTLPIHNLFSRPVFSEIRG